MMSKKLIFISGDIADAAGLDDSGSAIYRVQGGKHNGHQVTISTEKHNCGAYGESVSCSCGAYWQSAMYGCWQQGHQRQEKGDKSLREMTTLVYERVGEPLVDSWRQADGADTCAVCGGWLGSKRACDECGHIRPAE